MHVDRTCKRNDNQKKERKYIDQPSAWHPVKKEPKQRRENKPASKKSAPKRYNKPVEENIPMSTDAVFLVTSSHVHQRSTEFSEGKNEQGAVIATFAVMLYLTRQFPFTCEQLDAIITCGHENFMTLKASGFKPGLIPHHLLVMEHPTRVTHRLVVSSTYNNPKRVDVLTDNLSKLSAPRTGFILIGHGRAMSAWPGADNKMLLFNPHCVDKNNMLSTNAKKGAARLFRALTLPSLAAIMFKSDVCDCDNWTLYHIGVCMM